MSNSFYILEYNTVPQECQDVFTFCCLSSSKFRNRSSETYSPLPLFRNFPSAEFLMDKKLRFLCTGIIAHLCQLPRRIFLLFIASPPFSLAASEGKLAVNLRPLPIPHLIIPLHYFFISEISKKAQS